MRDATTGKRKFVCSILGALLLAGMFSAEAQQAKRIPRIAYFIVAFPSTAPTRTEGFRRGLRELGYVEGKNILIEYRYAEGNLDRLPVIAVELVHLKVDVIVSGGSQTTRSAKEATTKIPIVMAADSDPVGNGFVAGLEEPGGNITGLSNFAPELSGKRLELLKESIPSLILGLLHVAHRSVM